MSGDTAGEFEERSQAGEESIHPVGTEEVAHPEVGLGEAEARAPGEAGSAAPLEPEEGTVVAPAGLEERLGRSIAALRNLIEDRLTLDRFREAQIDRLHQELQEHKGDFLSRIVRPLLMGLIRLHNDLGRTLSALRERPTEEQTPARFFSAFDGVRDDLELLLEQHGVERFDTTESVFEPSRQTALRTRETGDAELVGHVAQRLRPGFAQGETLLQREGVAVYVAGMSSKTAADSVEPAADPEPGGDLE